MNKIMAGVAILLIGGVSAYLLLTDGGDTTETTQPQSRIAEEAPSVNTNYTTEEVAQKNSEDECWTIINDVVYDITEYIPTHPGGASAISLSCGVDGTRLFTERVDEDGQAVGSGSPHSAGADNVLQRYRIGVIQ